MSSNQPTQQLPEKPKLKFADEHIQPIFNGEKTITLRIGLDRSKFQKGDPILFCDENGDWFAEAEVKKRGYTTVEIAANMKFDGHQNYSNTDELIDTFQSYYPNEEITPNTRVEIIEWGELW